MANHTLKWTDEQIAELFASTDSAFAEKYDLSRGYVKTLRYRKRKHLKERKSILMEREPTLESAEHMELDRIRELLGDFREHGLPVHEDDAENVSRIKVWQMGYTDADGEGHVQTLRGVELKPETPDIDESQLFEQASPARITPTKSKPKKKDHVGLFVFSDAQIDFRRIIDHRTNEQELIPIHDERSIGLAHLICKDLRPEYIINTGDTIDLAGLSRFKPDSDHFHKTLGPSFQRVHDMYAQFRADNPEAQIIEVDSNHNTRLRDFVLKNFPQIYDMYRPGESGTFPVMTYPYLANFEHLGVEWISGYGAAAFIYGEEYTTTVGGREMPAPPIIFRHGTETSNNGTTASKIAKNNPDVHAVQGHDHDPQQYRRTNRLGQQIVSAVVPPLCSTTGEVPSYHSAVDDRNRVVHNHESWTNGVMYIRDYGGGVYEFDTISFTNGVAHYNGKEYRVD